MSLHDAATGLLRRLDELYLQWPFFGSRRMAVTLGVNRKRIQRLMRILGIEALYPKPNLSSPTPGHDVYPYLLHANNTARATSLNLGTITTHADHSERSQAVETTTRYG